MKLRALTVAFLLGAAAAAAIAWAAWPKPAGLGKELRAIGDTAGAVADREARVQAAIDSTVAALQPKVRYVDSVRWQVRHYVPPAGDSLSLAYWQTRARSAEALLELAADAGDVDATIHTRFQQAIEEGKRSSARLRAQLYSVRDSLQEKGNEADALESSLAQARKTLRMGIAVQTIAAGDCAIATAGLTIVARKTILGVEAEGQTMAGIGTAACPGRDVRTRPVLMVGGRATR